jgi:hypothetical protein
MVNGFSQFHRWHSTQRLIHLTRKLSRKFSQRGLRSEEAPGRGEYLIHEDIQVRFISRPGASRLIHNPPISHFLFVRPSIESPSYASKTEVNAYITQHRERRISHTIAGPQCLLISILTYIMQITFFPRR